MNTVVLLPGDEIYRFVINDLSQLVWRRDRQKDFVVLPETVSSFDVGYVFDDNIHIFATGTDGALFYIDFKDGNVKKNVIMQNRDSTGKICFVKALFINGRYHLFYCLNSEKRYLVHQVFSPDVFFEPEVIDTIGKRFLYDVAVDDHMNVHIVYASDENSLKHKKYIYSQKAYTEAATVCSASPRDICCCAFDDRVFASYTQLNNFTASLYIADVSAKEVTKAVMAVNNDTVSALNYDGKNLILYFENNGVCYEAKSDLSPWVSSSTTIGKCKGIMKLQSYLGASFRYPIGRDYLPLLGYDKFIKSPSAANNSPVISGEEAENFALKYKEDFDKKIQELQMEDFSRHLASIDASLMQLAKAAENILSGLAKTPKSDEPQKVFSENDELQEP